MANAKSISIVDKDGMTLQGHSWIIINPIANVYIFQGMEEHGFRYDYFAKALNDAGYSVYALDVYGQGLNAKEDLSNRGVWPIDAFNKQIDAYDKLIMENKKDSKPSILFCHSMGSYMGQGYIQKYSHHIDRIVLCGSGGPNGAVSIGYALAKTIVNSKNENEKAGILNKLMFGNFNKQIKNPETPYDWLSHDKENVDKYIKDPLCGYGPKNRFCLEFLKGLKVLYTKEGLNSIRKDLPILFIYGNEDPVTNYGKAAIQMKNLYAKYGIGRVKTISYDGYRHEILNEKAIRDKVIQDVVSFYKE